METPKAGTNVERQAEGSVAGNHGKAPSGDITPKYKGSLPLEALSVALEEPISELIPAPDALDTHSVSTPSIDDDSQVCLLRYHEKTH